MNSETIANQEPILSTGGGLDEKTLEKVFIMYFNALCAYCQYKYGLQPEAAKDAVHTSFLKLWEARNTISAGVSLQAYIYRVVSNTCLDIIKHSKVAQRWKKEVSIGLDESVFDNGFEKIDLNLLSAQIETAVNELPLQMRKVFILCRYDGLKYAEIADTLGLSIKTVEVQMSKAMARIRSKLPDYPLSFFICLVACYSF